MRTPKERRDAVYLLSAKRIKKRKNIFKAILSLSACFVMICSVAFGIWGYTSTNTVTPGADVSKNIACSQNNTYVTSITVNDIEFTDRPTVTSIVIKLNRITRGVSHRSQVTEGEYTITLEYSNGAETSYLLNKDALIFNGMSYPLKEEDYRNLTNLFK